MQFAAGLNEKKAPLSKPYQRNSSFMEAPAYTVSSPPKQ
jgi:hypothetical protein